MIFTKSLYICFLVFFFISPSTTSSYQSFKSQLKHQKYERIFKRSLKYESHRFKRQTQTSDIIFVYPTQIKPGSYLFTLAEAIDDQISYNIRNNTVTAMNLLEEVIIKDQPHFSLNSRSGVVSLQATPLPSTFNSFTIVIETVRGNTVEAERKVTMKLVHQTDWIFTNQPTPIWVTLGAWNRPYEPLITLKSKDAELHQAHDVRFSIEHGDRDTFEINDKTGDLYLNTRKEFKLGDEYTVVVSAQSNGVRLARRAAVNDGLQDLLPLPSQAINFKVGTKPPQFHASPFIIDFFENATVGQRIGQVQAMSFQELPLKFSMSPSQKFSLDETNGYVTLNTAMSYIKDTRKYEYEIETTESFTNFKTTSKLVLRLNSENHAPVFPVPYYVKYNVAEDIGVGTELLKLQVKDYDPDEMGRLEIVCESDAFSATETNGEISLKVAKPLDYESLLLKRYEFQVKAIDHGWPRLTGSTTVQIFVNNRNDKAPVFEPENQMITLQEGAQANLEVHRIQAYDPDGDNIRYTFNSDSQTGQYFSVDSNTGMIKLLKYIEPGRNELVSFNLSISITDDSSCCPGSPTKVHTTQGFVTIKIDRVNTQPTFPDCSSYKPNVKENAEPGNDPILTLTAKDDDKELNGKLSFSIPGDENYNFKVVQKPNGNEVDLLLIQRISRRTANVLKFNNTFKYPVVVKAVDQGTPKLSASCFLFVTIETINLETPKFDYAEQTVYFYINSKNFGDKIVRVFAFDMDFGLNGEVEYAFNDNADTDYSSCNTLFHLNPTNGWITWRGNQGSPTRRYKCEVRANDKGVPVRSSTSIVNIEITSSSNLQPPTWNTIGNVPIDDYEFSIPENTNLETNVLLLSATYPFDSKIEFYIPAENIDVFNGDGIFTASSNSSNNRGQMSVVVKKAIPEANLHPFYYLRCRAFVKSQENAAISLVSISRLKVNIQDVNNQAPKFLGTDSNGVYTAAVTPFTKAGDFVVVVTAVDLDRSWPNNKITYKIIPSEDSNLFSIDENSGRIKVSDNASPTSGNAIFNPGKKASYEFMVQALDGAPSTISNVNGPNKDEKKVRVIVNGARSSFAKFDKTYSTSISEVLPNRDKVIEATASFEENQPAIDNPLIHYNIRGGNEKEVFAVDIKKGVIYKVAALDADRKTFYQLKYTVFNGLDVEGPIDINITVTRDNFRPIVFNQNQYDYVGAAIKEKDPTSNGKIITTVGTLPINNNNQRIQYSVSNSEHFAIDDNGVVTIKKPLSRDVPDGFSPQQVNVRANFGGFSTGHALVALPLEDINDNPPLFDPCCVNGYIRENTINDGFQLKTFDADADINQEVTYSLIGVSDEFTVQSDGWIRAKKQLDFETKQKYTIRVKATDKGSPQQSSESDVSIFVVDVSEFTPSFSSPTYSVTINEELPLDSVVYSIKAEDQDPMDNLTYSLLSISGNDDNTYFYVENSQVFDGSYEDNNARMISTGVIKIAKRIDYDQNKKSLYEFRLQASDSSSRTTSTAVKVTVQDINDNAPLITPPFSSAILTANHRGQVTKFSASDLDSGINKQFSFLVDHENSDPMFHFGVDESSGQLSIQNAFNPDTPSTMSLKILAIDKGTPSLTGTAILNVTINGIDRRPPLIEEQAYPAVVSPNTRKGSHVYCVYGSQNNNYNYQLDCNGVDNCQDFKIDQGGCLTAEKDGYDRKKLDYNNYNIPVKITPKNNNNADLVTRQNVEVVMEGTTDTAPASASKLVHVVNYIDSDGGYAKMPLGNPYVKDIDDWDLHLKTFSIKQGDPYFFLEQKNNLYLRGDAGEGSHEGQVNVNDGTFNTAIASVNAVLSIVNKTALDNAASMRLIGLTDASELLRKPQNSDQTRLDLIKNSIKSSLDNSAKIDVLSIGNFNYDPIDDGNKVGKLVAKQVAEPDKQANKVPLVDLVYAAKVNDRYYSPELLNSIVNSKKSEIEKQADVGILMAPVDTCRSEFYNCWNEACFTSLINKRNLPRLINTNQTSFSGMSLDFEQDCFERPEMLEATVCLAGFCLNHGQCTIENTIAKCICRAGFNGPRCEKTTVSFVDPGGYMLLPPLLQTSTLRLYIEILVPSSSSSSLLLYSGPDREITPNVKIKNFIENQMKQFVSKDFLLLELVNGKPRLRIDFGDGELKAEMLGNNVNSLADSKWHSLSVLIEEKSITLMIDNCKSASITENIDSSTMDKSSCSVTVQRTSNRFLINTGSFPLQLGGRKDDASTYPPNWSKGKFQGCVRNLRVNSHLYDMSVGIHRDYKSAKEDCQHTDCSSCPASSTCRPLSSPGAPSCQCPPGFTGNSCSTGTASRYYDAEEYVQWTPNAEFNNQMNASQNWYSDSFQLMFRTRTENGVLFTVKSFSNLERYILELVDGEINFKYDLGSNDAELRLGGIKVNDGSWHWVRAERHGNQAELWLDEGQGGKYKISYPTEKHRLIKLTKMNILGKLTYNEWSKETKVENNLYKTCVSDVRYNGRLLSLTQSSELFQVETKGGNDDGCEKSGACDGQTCENGLVCVDLWRKHECRCEVYYPGGRTDVPNPKCIAVNCNNNPCLNGGSCTVIEGKTVCLCPSGYSGLACENHPGKKSESTSNFNLAAAIILPILFALLLICLLILLLWCCCCRNKEKGLLFDEPDKDIRENVIAYDDEGAGEEDNYGFDLSRLQNSNLETENIKKSIDFNSLAPTLTPSNQNTSSNKLPGPYSNIADFISDRMNDVDGDPNNLNDDTRVLFEDEGINTEVASLSSLASTQGDVDMSWLDHAGPPFGKLADMYGETDRV